MKVVRRAYEEALLEFGTNDVGTCTLLIIISTTTLEFAFSAMQPFTVSTSAGLLLWATPAGDVDRLLVCARY